MSAIGTHILRISALGAGSRHGRMRDRVPNLVCIGVFVRVSATHTRMRGIALLLTGGLSYGRFSIMMSVGFGIGVSITVLAPTANVLNIALLGAGGRNGLRNVIMPKRRGTLPSILILAAVAGVYRIARLCARGFDDITVYNVSKRCDIFLLIILTVCTIPALHPLLCASG